MTALNPNNLTLSGKPKPWLSTAPKPWHTKENAATSDQHPKIIEVEVIESKRPAPSIKGREKEEEYVLFSCAEADIVVPESIARISGLVCSILDSSGDYIEKQTRTIKFDHISANVLEEVIRFCSQECKENASFLQSLPQSSPSSLADAQVLLGRTDEKVIRTTFVFELKPDTVMELMAAAEYLQIPSLVSHIINMLAEYADDIPSFAGMSESLVEEVCNKCKPATIRRIEIDGKLASYEKDFTSPLWKRFCSTYADFVILNQKECHAKKITHNKYVTNENNNNNFATNESNEDVDWRRGYAELTLEKMMSKPPAKQTNDELQTFGSIFGSLVVYLRLFQANFDPLALSTACPNIQFLEITGDVGLHESQISSLVTHLPNLRYLRISNAGASPKFWLEFLTNIEGANLLELDISSNDIGQYVASFVATLLQKNPNIKMLNMANNPIQIEGFVEIATAGANLQALDASDCAIVTSQKSEATFHVTPILGHQLKVLKLSGNNLIKLSTSFWKFLFGRQQNTLERLELARVMWVQKDKDIRVLIRHFAEFPHIDYLDLSDNHIEEMGMEAICFNLLLSRAPLKTLILMGNTIKDTIAAGLARALRYNSSLQTLVLGSVSEYGLMELDGAIAENASSAIQKIVVDTKGPPQVVLSRPQLFVLKNASDPTKTYQMRWNPQPR